MSEVQENLGEIRADLTRLAAQLLQHAETSDELDDLTAMVAGIRDVRMALDGVEVAAGRAARSRGASIRMLARATGIAERNASNRYRPCTEEGAA